MKLTTLWLAGAWLLGLGDFKNPLLLLGQALWFFFCAGLASGPARKALELEASYRGGAHPGGLSVLLAFLAFLAVFAGFFYARLLGGGLPGGAVLGLGLSSGLVLAGARIYAPACAALGQGAASSLRLSLGATAAFPLSSAFLGACQGVFLVSCVIPVIGLGLGFSASGLTGLLGAERAASRLGLSFQAGRDEKKLARVRESEAGRTLREMMKPWEYR